MLELSCYICASLWTCGDANLVSLM